MKFIDGNKIRRIRDGIAGEVTGHWNHPYEGTLYMIRFADPGLDDDFEKEDAIELIYPYTAEEGIDELICANDECEHRQTEHQNDDGMGCMGISDYDPQTNGARRCHCPSFDEGTAAEVYIFPNGNVAVTNTNGQQMPSVQGSWINYDYLQRLAVIAVKDEPLVTGMRFLDHRAFTSLNAYFKHEKERQGKNEPDKKA